MKKTARKFPSFSEAEKADRDFYEKLTGNERLQILVELLNQLTLTEATPHGVCAEIPHQDRHVVDLGSGAVTQISRYLTRLAEEPRQTGLSGLEPRLPDEWGAGDGHGAAVMELNDL